jgi:hypothetical protein
MVQAAAAGAIVPASVRKGHRLLRLTKQQHDHNDQKNEADRTATDDKGTAKDR